MELDPYDKLLFPVHIQANLEDELVKEALKTVRLSTILICPSTYPPLTEKKNKTVSCLLYCHLGILSSSPPLILFQCPFTATSS